MVSIIINRYDLEKGDVNKLIIHQIEMLAKTISSDYKFHNIKLKIGMMEMDNGYQ